MSGPRPSTSSAVLAIRRIASKERRDPGSSGPELPAILHETTARAFANLREALGEDGCSALASRAFAQCQWEHPAVATLRGAADCDVPREHILAAVEAHGPAATASAVEAVLIALSDILARIIGDDMAIGIMDHQTPRAASDEGGSS